MVFQTAKCSKAEFWLSITDSFRFALLQQPKYVSITNYSFFGSTIVQQTEGCARTTWSLHLALYTHSTLNYNNNKHMQSVKKKNKKKAEEMFTQLRSTKNNMNSSLCIWPIRATTNYTNWDLAMGQKLLYSHSC